MKWFYCCQGFQSQQGHAFSPGPGYIFGTSWHFEDAWGQVPCIPLLVVLVLLLQGCKVVFLMGQGEDWSSHLAGVKFRVPYAQRMG